MAPSLRSLSPPAARLGHDTGKFELHQDHVDQCMHRRATGLDNEVCGEPIQGIAIDEQRAQASERVGTPLLQQRPMRIVPQSPCQVFGRRTQVDDCAALAQHLPVGIAQDGSAPSSDDVAAELRHLVDHLPFDISKRSFALGLEVVPNRAADPPLDDLVGINENKPELPSDVATDSGLATAGHAHEGDQRTVSGSISLLRPHLPTLADNAALADDSGRQEDKQLGAR